jgi:hypothetical protein
MKGFYGIVSLLILAGNEGYFFSRDSGNTAICAFSSISVMAS